MTERETDRQRVRETERQRDRETERQRDRETGRERQTDRQNKLLLKPLFKQIPLCIHLCLGQ